MRIKINFKPSNVEIPAFKITDISKSYLHKIIGTNNEYHDKFSLYSITSLMRGKYNRDNKSYSFPIGTYIIFSTIDENLINIILTNIYKVNFGYGLDLFGIDIIEESFTNGNNYITTLSPILLRNSKIKSKKDNAVTFENKLEFETLITEKTLSKIKRINNNLITDNFSIKLTNDNKYNKVKIIPINGIPNITSRCNLVVNSNPEVMKILYNTGLGMSTGCGFGTFYNTNNYNRYNLK